MFGAFHNWPGALILLPASGDIRLGDLVSSSVARYELSASKASSADLQQSWRLSCHPQDSSAFCTVPLLFQVVEESLFFAALC